MSIIDVSHYCGDRAHDLAQDGVTTVIRYYSSDTSRPTKRLSPHEARQLSAAGLRLAVVYEGFAGNKPGNFDRARGIADARYARTYGASTIGQPGGTVIFFAVDFDALADQVTQTILPYFQGILDAFAQATGEPDYVIGVYGSGAVCEALLTAGLVQCTWLAQSKGWRGYNRFSKSGRWSLSQEAATQVAGVSCDTNQLNPELSLASFSVPQTPSSQQGASTMYVNARSGLRLRSGPGTDFDNIRLLPYGSAVHALKATGNWTCVDLQGDGIADGFVSSAFLTETLTTGIQPEAISASSSQDSVHIRELIQQGSSAAGLAAARATASASLKGYPTNGCAAHLSALLQQAAVAVPMTWGAGKLAHLLESRGWRRINVGAQQPGDVGVCFDNTSPPGADHVYLVISILGSGEMLVADNQNPDNAPHSRFQKGHGKTDTEYFLRAL